MAEEALVIVQEEALAKVSGDLLQRPDVSKWLKQVSERYLLTIVIGGGTQISKALKMAGFSSTFQEGDQGREIFSNEGKQLALRILEDNKKDMEQQLADLEIPARVEIPVLYTHSGRLVHVNGDQWVKTYHSGYDHVYVVTLKSRYDNKVENFAGYRRVEVKAFPDDYSVP